MWRVAGDNEHASAGEVVRALSHLLPCDAYGGIRATWPRDGEYHGRVCITGFGSFDFMCLWGHGAHF